MNNTSVANAGDRESKANNIHTPSDVIVPHMQRACDWDFVLVAIGVQGSIQVHGHNTAHLVEQTYFLGPRER